MLIKIKNRIERALFKYTNNLDKTFSINKISPILSRNIKEYILRTGKRARPILFIVGYMGFSKKPAFGLYTSAISLELLHDFMLIHDDIIDKSDIRRGKPSMHKMLDNYLLRYKKLKFNGQDLAIVIGDVIYATSIHAFLSIKENMQRKENALKKFIEAAIYTGSGEFIELLYGAKDIEDISKKDIYKIYDYKTASYTFATPLASGAILAGAKPNQADVLYRFGIYLGRAFQIKDDILGMFGNESEIGKSVLTDLRESKKTILIWYAYHNSGRKDKLTLKGILKKESAKKNDLLTLRKIIVKSGALDYSKREIFNLIRKSQLLNCASGMFPKYKDLLFNYSQDILRL